MAIKTNSPIISFAIQGKFRPLKKGLKLVIGKPIYVTNMNEEEANEYLRNKVFNLLKSK